MTQIVPGVTYPVKSGSPHATTPAYSGTFIPTIWSAKLNAKFYPTSTFASVSNTDWQGEIKGGGADKVIIRTRPDIVTRKYVVGEGLTYDVANPDTQELLIDKGRSFSFQVSDVLEYQSDMKLMSTFTDDAAEQMRIAIDSNCWYRTFSDAAAANKGPKAGRRSGGYNLGTDAAPIALTPTNVLEKILALASVLDEQDVPAEGRYLVLSPQDRMLLLQSPLAQAYVTGDAKSPLRNGLIGMIDRFQIYVTNLLPRATGAAWVSGNGEENDITSAGGVARRVIIAGHNAALTFASQFTKTETLPNPNDFGQLVRGVNVYGMKTVHPQSLATLVVA